MNVEDRLRAALHGTADLVEDRPRPLPAARHGQGLTRFLPAWAALVVASVVLGPFVLPDGKPDAPIPVSSPSLAIGSAPEFYVAVYGATEGRKSRFEVRSTATGEVLAINAAGNEEDFVSIASVPDDGMDGVASFYLLTRLGAGLQPGCTEYTIYSIQISAEGKFTQWGTGSITFEALDGTPANLATTPKGDEIAYSYESCGRKVVKGNTEHQVGDGETGERLIAHRWAGTTTLWRTEGKVGNLAYSPDGQTLAAFLRETKAEDGGPRGELRLTRVGNPRSGFTDETENDVALSADEALPLVNAMITPDGKKVVALLSGSRRTVTSYTVQEFPLGAGAPRSLGSLKPAADHPANLDVLMKQHPSGPELLFQVADSTFLRGARPEGTVVVSGTAPDDLAW